MLVNKILYGHLSRMLQDLPESSTRARPAIEQARTVPAAIWIDKKDRLHGADDPSSLEGALTLATSLDPPPMLLLVMYNLPNRDCSAKASEGEICCTQGSDGRCDMGVQDHGCADGLAEYKNEYVQPFVDLLAQFSHVPVAVIIEPDSLPNMVTNSETYKGCGPATREAYMNGIAFALTSLRNKAPHATLYLDAAHGGWLGWEDVSEAFAKLVCEELPLDFNVSTALRGFSTNVANYNPIGADACPSEAFEGEESPGHYW